jgi:hypothetical protein
MATQDKFYDHHLNLTQHQLKNAAIEVRATAPGSPVQGQMYFDTVFGLLRQWTGTVWVTYDAPKPAFRVNRSGAVPAQSNNVQRFYPFNNVVFDTHAGFNTGTSIYTCPEAGLYVAGHANQLNAQTANMILQANVYQNGGLVASGSSQCTQTAAAAGPVAFIETVLNCAAGDTIQFWYLYSGTPGTYQTNAGNPVSVYGYGYKL